MRMFLGAALAAFVLGACASSGERASAPAAEPYASVSELMAGVELPYDTFTLDNGLTVVVHEDHKAPIISVAAWFNVGSKDEPPAAPALPTSTNTS
ncbi:MAG: hypothetical protein WDM79_02390 [Terricaulis sp.]